METGPIIRNGIGSQEQDSNWSVDEEDKLIDKPNSAQGNLPPLTRLRATRAPRDPKVTTEQTKANVRAEPAKKPEAPKIPVEEATDLKSLRAKEWGKWLYNDANPLLMKGTQQICQVPDDWMSGVVVKLINPQNQKEIVFWDPPLEQRLKLSEKECNTLARAAAEFSISPMGMAIAAWVKANSQLIAMGSAMFVAGAYGWRLMQIRTEVAQLKELQAQRQQAEIAKQQAMQMADQNGGGVAA